MKGSVFYSEKLFTLKQVGKETNKNLWASRPTALTYVFFVLSQTAEAQTSSKALI